MGKDNKLIDGSPADVLIQIAKSQATEEPQKAKAKATAKGTQKKDKPQAKPTEEPQSKPKKERKKKTEEEKRGYRINLALRKDIGEEVKRMADAENRSVNNYIEQLILDHLKNRKEKP